MELTLRMNSTTRQKFLFLFLNVEKTSNAYVLHINLEKCNYPVRFKKIVRVVNKRAHTNLKLVITKIHFDNFATNYFEANKSKIKCK